MDIIKAKHRHAITSYIVELSYYIKDTTKKSRGVAVSKVDWLMEILVSLNVAPTSIGLRPLSVLDNLRQLVLLEYKFPSGKRLYLDLAGDNSQYFFIMPDDKIKAGKYFNPDKTIGKINLLTKSLQSTDPTPVKINTKSFTYADKYIDTIINDLNA